MCEKTYILYYIYTTFFNESFFQVQFKIKVIKYANILTMIKNTLVRASYYYQ